MTFPPKSLGERHGFVVGKGERPHLGEGWWDRMEWPDRPGLFYRPSKPEAELRLHAREGADTLHLLVTASLAMIGGPGRLQVLRDGKSLGEIDINCEDWSVQTLPCPVDSPGTREFTLRTLTPCVPHHTLQNGDHREFGVHVAAAHLS